MRGKLNIFFCNFDKNVELSMHKTLISEKLHSEIRSTLVKCNISSYSGTNYMLKKLQLNTKKQIIKTKLINL